ncbi:MAG: hypothetical protein ACU84J_05675 [Gammaproteobacteria bacterium]
MNNPNEKLALKVVDVFKQNISAEARAHISDAEFHELAQIVEEALSLEMAEAAAMVEELEQRLKDRAGRRELEL